MCPARGEKEKREEKRRRERRNSWGGGNGWGAVKVEIDKMVIGIRRWVAVVLRVCEEKRRSGKEVKQEGRCRRGGGFPQLPRPEVAD